MRRRRELTSVSYSLIKRDIPDYQLQIAEKGCCPALAVISCFRAEDRLNVTADTSGLFHFKTFLSLDAMSAPGVSQSSLGLFKETLGALRRTVEAIQSIQEYLIPLSSLTLELEYLYFDKRKGKAVLFLMPSQKNLTDSMSALCLEIFSVNPASSADVIAQRLLLQNAETLLDCKAMLRLLSSWEFELA
jgi:hypothetical protein